MWTCRSIGDGTVRRNSLGGYLRLGGAGCGVGQARAGMHRGADQGRGLGATQAAPERQRGHRRLTMPTWLPGFSIRTLSFLTRARPPMPSRCSSTPRGRCSTGRKPRWSWRIFLWLRTTCARTPIIACMEAANEAARRAVNCLLAVAGRVLHRRNSGRWRNRHSSSRFRRLIAYGSQWDCRITWRKG